MQWASLFVQDIVLEERGEEMTLVEKRVCPAFT
jgi:hypothetical protein